MAVNKERQEHLLSSSVGFNLPSLLNFLKQVYVLIKPGVISLVIFTAVNITNEITPGLIKTYTCFKKFNSEGRLKPTLEESKCSCLSLFTATY